MKLLFWLIVFSCLPLTLRSMDYTIFRCTPDPKKHKYIICALPKDLDILNILGTINYSLDPQSAKGYINALLVEKQYRNEGIATRLLLESCKDLKQKGCNTVSGMPFPIINNIPSLLENPHFRMIIALYLFEIVVSHYLPNNQKLFHLGCNVAEAYTLWKFLRSRVGFYKNLGAKQSFFSITASCDLTEKTICSLEQKFEQKRNKIVAPICKNVPTAKECKSLSPATGFK